MLARLCTYAVFIFLTGVKKLSSALSSQPWEQSLSVAMEALSMGMVGAGVLTYHIATCRPTFITGI